MPGCIDESDAIGYVDGGLGAAARDRVDAHIADCADCRRLIAELARGLGETEADDGDGATGPHPPRAGDMIGRYEVRELRARGGMGSVYEAYDPKLDRLVAIKIMSAGGSGSGSSSQGRMVREAHALAKLSHPNVVPVFDVGELGDDIYIAMELCDGVTLREWLRQRERDTADIVEVFCDAGRGLAAAHDQGMVHRDFKPANVLVGDDGRVRVVDFGLVRASGVAGDGIGAAASPLSPVDDTTRTGTIVGTPAYMAPEQHADAAVDHRADQFSFAVALWEAVYGERPFAGDTQAEVHDAALAGRIRAAPSGSRVPARLRAVLARALDAEPEHRFESMSDMLDALSPRRRRVLPLAIASAAAAAIAAVSVWSLAGGSDDSDRCQVDDRYLAALWSPDARRHAEAAWKRRAPAGTGAAFARIADRLDRYRDDFSAVYQRACTATFDDASQDEARFESQQSCLFDRLERARTIVTSIEGTAAAGGPAKATIDSAAVDGLVAAAQRLPDIASCERPTEQLGLPVPPTDKRDQVAALRAELSAAATRIDLAGVDKPLARAEQLVTRAEAVDFAPLTVDALYLLGRVLIERAQPARAETVLRRAVSIAAAANLDSALAALWVELTTSLFEQGKISDAVALAPVAEAAMVRAGSDARLRARGLQAIGEAAWWIPDYERALALVEQAADLIEETYGEEDPDLPLALALVAEALLDNGEIEKADEQARRAVALARARFGADHSITAWAELIAAMAVRRSGKPAEALVAFERIRAKMDRISGEHPETAYVDREIGLSHFALGDYDKAAAAHRRAVDLTRRRRGKNDFRVSLHLENVGRTEHKRGNYAAALEALQQAHEVRARSRGPSHETTAEIEAMLGELELVNGNAEAGVAWFDRALVTYVALGDREDVGDILSRAALAADSHPRSRQLAIGYAERALVEYTDDGIEQSAAKVREWLAKRKK